MADTNPTGWELLRSVATEKIIKLREKIKDETIHLEVIIVATEVFRKHGESHPSQYGVGQSEMDIRDIILHCRDDLDRWENALRLIDDAAQDSPQVVTVLDK